MCLHHSNICSHICIFNAVGLRANGYNVWDSTKIWKLSNLVCTECTTGRQLDNNLDKIVNDKREKSISWKLYLIRFWSYGWGIISKAVPAAFQFDWNMCGFFWFTNLLSAIWCSTESKLWLAVKQVWCRFLSLSQSRDRHVTELLALIWKVCYLIITWSFIWNSIQFGWIYTGIRSTLFS